MVPEVSRHPSDILLRQTASGWLVCQPGARGTALAQWPSRAAAVAHADREARARRLNVWQLDLTSTLHQFSEMTEDQLRAFVEDKRRTRAEVVDAEVVKALPAPSEVTS